MTARTLSGSIRAASVRRPRVSFQAPATPAPSPAPAPAAAPLATVERGGVLYVVGRDGAPLAPVSSARVAASFGRVLARLGVT